MYEYVLHSRTLSLRQKEAESLEMMTLMLCMTKFIGGSREVGGGGSEPTTTSPGKFELTQFT